MSGEPGLDSKLSKAQKKNKKRAGKRFHERIEERKSQQPEPEETVQTTQQNPMEVLKGLLAEAKSSKDHKLAAKLRQDLWVLQDAYAGMNSELSTAEIEKTMARISKIVEMSAPNEQVTEQKPDNIEIKTNDIEIKTNETETKVNDIETKSEPVEDETHNNDNPPSSDPKRLRNLKKKLGQINKLKQRQESGEVLESEQIEKIATEAHVLEQIELLQNKTSLSEILKNK